MSTKKARFKKLLVANRGEIAIRILRAASELKLRTVAIYTFEDRYSLHRYKADESYQIGEEDNPLKPYLDIEAIIQIAKNSNVDAIHPGYGFLSENVNFARRCRAEGIIFVGPTPEAMAKLGDKVAAKKIARKVKVPLIEDSQKKLTNDKIALAEAKRIGFPVMVKAAAGGGGRGMRVVRSAKALVKAFNEAKGEAKTAFGDDTIFIEKYVENPKHIEVQILGDQYGNRVHLFERDCSVQRRFQKVVEVAPCSDIKQSTKEKLYDYALKIAAEVDYSNAGTVEFLVDKKENIYFIEVNPRIQVEHTITEEITGIDIVASQLFIAMGYPLSHRTIEIMDQSDIKCNGFAIQCRVTTENPKEGFKPDYGTLVAYRSCGGMGIRLDAGSAYDGAKISPFFDSMLVKVTANGRSMKGACERLQRALSEFRIRGVQTNISFLQNLLENKTFQEGKARVNFIADNPGLIESRRSQDRGTKLLTYLSDVIVNGNSDVKYVDATKHFAPVSVPAFDASIPYRKGTKDQLNAMGREKFVAWVKSRREILFTDTTFRDAHQSLLATRVRTKDLMNVAESFARNHGHELFSMEVWGGATFDVCMRFLKEDPWTRLKEIRKAAPNVLLQMLLRGANAVGYKAYPDNLIEAFIIKAADTGIDVFRIFDSLNWIENMKFSIKTVRKKTNAIAQACICYTGDILDKNRTKYTLEYYVDLAKKLEDAGAHMICIKDMAGLLKPDAATVLVKALKKAISIPVQLHTHDTSSIQSATYLNAIKAKVDVVDVALSSMAGLTSQPSFNAMVAMTKGTSRASKVDLKSLQSYADYWEAVRTYYYPFETELKGGTADVYEHEIPGGQYSNLRPQARGLGLEDQFETIKTNYRIVNDLLGDIIKVTPSSKVVGDMALFMTANGLTKEDIMERGEFLAFPDSMKSLMRGDLGQTMGGFPKKIQRMVLKGEKAYRSRPNAKLEPVDFKKEFKIFQKKFGNYVSETDFLSYKLYPKVYEAFFDFAEVYGPVRHLPTPAFFYGLQPNEETLVSIESGKNLLIRFLSKSLPNEQGNVEIGFKLNGQTRTITIKDRSVKTEEVIHRKSELENEIGSPLQGSLSTILVKEGQKINANTPLFIIEAMKMESTITSPIKGKVVKIHLLEKTMVEQDDLIIELG